MHKKIRTRVLGATGQVGGHLIKALKSEVSLEVVKLRASLGAIRYASASLRQLPLQPWRAALVMSLVLGILPMILTALCSAACSLLNRCRYAGRPRHHLPANKSDSDALINYLELQ